MGAEEQDTAAATRCRACEARLAADQRYCISCGERRGSLAAAVRQALALHMERGAAPQQEGPQPPDGQPRALVGDPAPQDRPLPWLLRGRLPGPRAIAATVLAALAVGVLAGTYGGNTAESLASAPLLLVESAPGHSATPTAGTSAADDTATTRTITETTPASATPTPSSGTGQSSGAGGNSGAGANAGGGSGGGTAGGQGAGGILGLPAIKHVFVILLSGEGYNETFSPAGGDPYLSRTLARRGEVVANYYSVGASTLANGVALISGQGPTALEEFDCPIFQPIAPTGMAAEEQVLGSGCVYPKSTRTVADQLTKHKLTWKAYLDAMDTARGQMKSCRRPPLGQPDPYLMPRPGDAYVTSRNPFVYFRSLTAGKACAADDVGLTVLKRDLKRVPSTPSLSYIVPSPCEDGSSTPCRPGAAAGLTPADAFLRRVLAEIESSAAYKADGLIAITSDLAPQSGPKADQSACCNTPAYPNLPDAAPAPTATTPTTTTTPTSTAPATTSTTTTPTSTTSTTTTPATTTTTPTTTSSPTTSGTTTTPTTPTTTTTTPTPSSGGETTPTGGGGQVGLLLISRFVKPGSSDAIDYYNHFSLLATIENLFGLSRLGFAGDPNLPVFDATIFNAHHP